MEWLSSLGLFGTIVRGLIVFIEAIMVLNLMILVHEWGHFLAARWRGLKVEKFYIWFGKPIWKRTYNGVEYGLGSIPLGGFVQLPQMGPMGGLEGDEPSDAKAEADSGGEPSKPVAEKLSIVSPLDKIIVAFAGPLFSFLLAVVFAFLVWGVGMPDRRIHTTTLGYVMPDTPGFKAGLKPGDVITHIDGREVHSWDEPVDSVKERIAFSKEPQIVFTVKRPGEAKPLDIKSGFNVEPGTWFQRRGLRTVGLLWSYPAKVYELLKGGAAERAGIQKGDLITHVDGVALSGPEVLQDMFKDHPTTPVKLSIKRGDAASEITMTPLSAEKPAKVPDYAVATVLSGIRFANPGEASEIRSVNPPPGEQIKIASTTIFRTLGAVFGRKGDVGFQQMGGPVKIVSTLVMLFQIPDGWKLVFWFSVLLNVNLALMNMLPFPVLDGGHIVMAIGEWFRRGSLLPIRIMEYVQTACVLVLMGFFVYVTWFDVNDFSSGGTRKEEPFKLEDVVYPAAK